jgi:hypothetical protein
MPFDAPHSSTACPREIAIWQPETHELGAMIMRSRSANKSSRGLTPREREDLFVRYADGAKIITAAQVADIRNWAEFQIVAQYGK